MNNIYLRGVAVNFLNIHAPEENKIDDMVDRFYDEIGSVFDKFPNYHMKIKKFHFRSR
jgi:hypothetical protein